MSGYQNQESLALLPGGRLGERGTLDLSGFYVVFTYNIASADVQSLQHSTFASLERHVFSRAQQSMRPELYGRISEKLVFNKLTYEVLLEITRLLLVQELEFLSAKGHCIDPAENVLQFLVRRGFHSRPGARPMRDAVEKSIGDAVRDGPLYAADQRRAVRTPRVAWRITAFSALSSFETSPTRHRNTLVLEIAFADVSRR